MSAHQVYSTLNQTYQDQFQLTLGGNANVSGSEGAVFPTTIGRRKSCLH